MIKWNVDLDKYQHKPLSPSKYKSSIITLSPSKSRKLFSESEDIPQMQIPTQDSKISKQKYKITTEFPTNPDLDMHMVAMKFRFRWYLRKFRIGIRKHKIIYQKFNVFKRFTIAIIKEIEQQK